MRQFTKIKMDLLFVLSGKARRVDNLIVHEGKLYDTSVYRMHGIIRIDLKEQIKKRKGKNET